MISIIVHIESGLKYEAAVAWRLKVDPKELTAFVAYWLIPLDKVPGVRPIRIGDVSRRIIAIAILHVICTDIQLAASALQACASHDARAEATIYAMRDIFADNNTDVLLVDASNAFNQVNRQCALHNISILYPSFCY